MDAVVVLFFVSKYFCKIELHSNGDEWRICRYRSTKRLSFFFFSITWWGGLLKIGMKVLRFSSSKFTRGACCVYSKFSGNFKSWPRVIFPRQQILLRDDGKWYTYSLQVTFFNIELTEWGRGRRDEQDKTRHGETKRLLNEDHDKSEISVLSNFTTWRLVEKETWWWSMCGQLVTRSFRF